MDGHPPQELLDFDTAFLDEGCGEAGDGLFFGKGWDDGSGAFFVEAGVEPEEVGVALEDCGVGRVCRCCGGRGWRLCWVVRRSGRLLGRKCICSFPPSVALGLTPAMQYAIHAMVERRCEIKEW